MYRDLKRPGEDTEILNVDKTDQPVGVHNYIDQYRGSKYEKYDLSDIDPSGQQLASPEAIQGVLDFIAGLKQTREDCKKPVNERMTHSEKEVVDELAKQFESAMQLDEKEQTQEEEAKDFKPVFKSKKDRNTLSNNAQRKKRKGLLVGSSEQKREDENDAVMKDYE